MGIIKTLNHTYDNFYTEEKENITLYFYIQPGFSSIDDCRSILEGIDEDPDNYVYVDFNNTFYPVGMEGVSNEAVFGKETVYYRNGRWDYDHFEGTEKRVPLKTFLSNKPISIISRSRYGGWTTGMLECLKTLNDGLMPNVIIGKNLYTIKDPKKLYSDSRFVPESAIVLLGTTFFATMVPVFELNSMDFLFGNSPSRWKLWEKGIIALNPFTGGKIKTIDKMKYTKEEWLTDREKGRAFASILDDRMLQIDKEHKYYYTSIKRGKK